MYYTIYKTTNLINGKIYIGCHKTKDLDDGYIGSGLLLKRAISKYGIDNFQKEILAVFKKSSEMFETESQLVNEEFVKRSDTYNLKQGGNGGWDHCTSNSEMQSDKAKLSNLRQKELSKDPEWVKRKNKKISRTLKDGYKKGIYKISVKNYFTGKTHTEETKKKIGKANSKHQKGSGNSQYGTMWIHNLELKKSKRIQKNEQIPEGWLKGRKINF